MLPSAKIPYWQSTQMGSDAKKTLSRNSADCVAPVLALERTSVHQQMFLQWFHAPFWFSRFGWRQLVDLSLLVLEFRSFFFFFVFHGCDFKRSTRCIVAVDLSNRTAVKRISLWNCQPWDKTEWAYLRSSRRLVAGVGLGGEGVHAVGNTSQCVWWRWSASEQQK